MKPAPAQTSSQIQSLRAQIKVNAEWVGEDADAQCLRATGRTLEQITTDAQAFEVLKLQAREREASPRVDDTPRGYCFNCGAIVAADQIECRRCHEGIGGKILERESWELRRGTGR